MPIFTSKSDKNVAHLFVDSRFTPESVEKGTFTGGRRSKVEKIVESHLDPPTDELRIVMDDALDPALVYKGSAACVAFLKAFGHFAEDAEIVFAYRLRFDRPYRDY